MSKTLSRKIFESHLCAPQGESAYAFFHPDRVALQDATAQMAILQFMNAGKSEVAVPASVHCDHLIQADHGAKEDLAEANKSNKEVYDFLRSAAMRYGMDFWEPGAGIIHQVVLENYAVPGQMMIGTDSHTPNAGGLGMIAIGVGGADAVDVLTGQAWELRVPRIIGVHLVGELSGWSSPKDVILNILGKLTVKGGTNAVLEYFGEGVKSISATGRATICNMGAELGATCSIFPYDSNTEAYLRETGRSMLADDCNSRASDLTQDEEVLESPEKFYDQVIEIDLSAIKPHVNGPFTPDAATLLSEMREKGPANDFPMDVEIGLIGSCTNSSYEDLSKAASVVKQALDKNIPIKAQLIVSPGSEMIRNTAERDGIFDIFRAAGAIIMTNACGPCIGQWHRHTDDPSRKNTILTSFNRNFKRRADGNPNTFAFIGSPEIVTALAIAGRLDFDPSRDSLLPRDGVKVMLEAAQGSIFPNGGFAQGEKGVLKAGSVKADEVIIVPGSERLQRLEPFAAWDGEDLSDLALLIKVKGKCTTDHISMAGPWLKYRGHLENISKNLLSGAVNAFTNAPDGLAVAETALSLKKEGTGSIVVAEDNYGEGSSREHAAMEPRFLGVRAILAKSFARIHETNLKKQGMLALTFADSADYDKVLEGDRISILGLNEFAPGKPLQIILTHKDGTKSSLIANHTYNELQIKWFKAGSALNFMASKN